MNQDVDCEKTYHCIADKKQETECTVVCKGFEGDACAYQDDCTMAVSTKCAGMVKDMEQDNDHRQCVASTQCGKPITIN